jgi:UDP-glucose 4-epimerase
VILDSLAFGPRAFIKDRIFYEGDVADRPLLRRILEEHPDIECTIHMAARVVVPESVEKPFEYYCDNVCKSLDLFDELVRLGNPRVVVSSTASVYAMVKDFEIDEGSPLDPCSPYDPRTGLWRTPFTCRLTGRYDCTAGIGERYPQTGEFSSPCGAERA